MYADASKTNDRVAVAVVSSRNYKKPYACRLHGDSSISTVELRTILLALNHVYHSKEIYLLFLPDSLSTLQAIHNLTYDYSVLMTIHELYSQLIQEERGFFVWIPGHVGIRGNSAADSAAKDALDGDIPDEFITISDPKPRLNNYIFELWQREWHEYPKNKLHKIVSTLTDRLPSRCLIRREETALSRLHVGHSRVTHLFLLKGESPPCSASSTNPFQWNIFYFPVRIGLISDKTLKVLFKEVSADANLQLFETY